MPTATDYLTSAPVGQQVLTRNQNDPTGALQEETVTAVPARRDTVYSLRDVTIENANPDNTSRFLDIGTGGTTETIDTTDSHPFYVQGQGFPTGIHRGCQVGIQASMPQGADDLVAGEILSTPDGQTETVVGTTSVAESQAVLVYNFTVADDHTYFVEGFGNNGTTGSAGGSGSLLDAVWVHNECNPLRNSLIQFGIDPAAEESAHHIVAAAKAIAQPARDILAKYRILTKDSINGVFLPQDAKAANILGKLIHTATYGDAYYLRVNSLLRNADQAGGQAAVERELVNIANALLDGRLP